MALVHLFLIEYSSEESQDLLLQGCLEKLVKQVIQAHALKKEVMTNSSFSVSLHGTLL